MELGLEEGRIGVRISWSSSSDRSSAAILAKSASLILPPLGLNVEFIAVDCEQSF